MIISIQNQTEKGLREEFLGEIILISKDKILSWSKLSLLH